MLAICKEFVEFLLTRKKYWLLPIGLTLMVVGALLLVSSGSAVAPFVYTMF